MNFINILKENYNIKLNEQQQNASIHKNGTALVLAGPGSGKTTVITARTAYLIKELGIKPECILTLTFNRAAKFEMERRFNNIFGASITQKVHFSTFHSFCNLVVRDYERRQGKHLKRIEGDEGIEESKRKIIKNIYYQTNGTNINDDELENLINEIGLVKNKMLKEFEGMNFGIKNFPLIYKTYEEYKKTNLYMDFDDMLTYAYSILTKCPDILQYYKNKYHYFQVDEGQDLSKIQFEILKLLVKSEQNNLFIVADDDQSIYGFRGAEPQYILDIGKQFPDCKLFKLENNYRSSKNIVQISSSFIKMNLERYDKNHTTCNDHKQDPFVIQLKDEDEQLQFLVDKIKTHWSENHDTQIAVLYRSNLSSITIADMLERKGIPFKVKQNKLFFFKHWVVQDILAFLRFSLNQCDIESFTRIYYKMNRYISKSMIDYLGSVDCAESIIDGILSSEMIKPFQKSTLSKLKKEFNQLAKMNPLHAFDYIENSFKYFDSVHEYCESTGLSFDYLYRLFGILKTIAEECSTIPMFLQRIEELEQLFERTNSSEYRRFVTLTTMHSSKGLEYDCVFMVDLNNSETPGDRTLEDVSGGGKLLLEEERRLFYVGMTRAKEYLYLVSPQIRDTAPEKRSIFVDEVIQCMKKDMQKGIHEGSIIYHKKFGKGIIKSIYHQSNTRTILEIDFKGMNRKLDLHICLESGLLSFEKLSIWEKLFKLK